MKRLSHIFAFIIVVILVFVSFNSLLPNDISKADAPLTQFSTERALSQLEVIAKEPHFVGTQAHTDVRNYIVSELKKMGLQPQLQEGFTRSSWQGYNNLVKPINILARIKGSGNGKAVLLMSHRLPDRPLHFQE